MNTWLLGTIIWLFAVYFLLTENVTALFFMTCAFAGVTAGVFGDE